MSRINHNSRKTQCVRGHPFDSMNTYISPSTGHRSCRTCRRASSAKQAILHPERKITREALRRYATKQYFGGNRELVIQRDGEKCLMCGMTRAEHKAKYGRDITVDHIDGRGRYTPRHLRNNSPDNLQTLCLRCHGRKDIKRKRRSSYEPNGRPTETRSLPYMRQL